MKKIALLSLTILMFSCGYNKEEQMLYDYQQKNAKALNFDLKDLDYKVQNIVKITDITAADSLKTLKLDLAEYWINNPEQSLVDTLSFKHVKSFLNKTISELDSLSDLFQQTALMAIQSDNFSSELKSVRLRDEAINSKTEFRLSLSRVETLEKYYDKLSKKPDSILSSKYQANYSLINPLLGNTRQTFDKIFYTNSTQTEFVKEENVDEK